MRALGVYARKEEEEWQAHTDIFSRKGAKVAIIGAGMVGSKFCVRLDDQRFGLGDRYP